VGTILIRHKVDELKMSGERAATQTYIVRLVPDAPIFESIQFTEKQKISSGTF
jgi:hypothetical protein